MHRSATRRCVSSGSKWISNFRYGFDGAPVLGSFAPKHEADSQQRQLYCKALVYASCGSRMARDWIAGCAALSASDNDLVTIALQHDGSRDDLVRFLDALRRRQGKSAHQQTTSSFKPAATEDDDELDKLSPASDFFLSGYRKVSLEDLSPASSVAASDGLTLSTEPLSDDQVDTIARCFIYDAVRAACFHNNALMPEQIRHFEHVCDALGVRTVASSDGTAGGEERQAAVAKTDNRPSCVGSMAAACKSSNPFLGSILELVHEENILMREKFRAIEQPSSSP